MDRSIADTMRGLVGGAEKLSMLFVILALVYNHSFSRSNCEYICHNLQWQLHLDGLSLWRLSWFNEKSEVFTCKLALIFSPLLLPVSQSGTISQWWNSEKILGLRDFGLLFCSCCIARRTPLQPRDFECYFYTQS